MIVRGEVTGLVLLGGKASGEEFSSDDFETIHAMVRHIGVGIHTHRLLEQLAQRAEENRRLYDELRAIYRDTVRAFAAAIDIKDKYTQGHSERVGRYSEIIAREMGWSEEEVEGIQIAGYLHDIGKLIVDRDIINAPYHIDAKNSSELNRHPAAGYEILAPIKHPYADIPLMAKYHHERLDGRGYPDGLTDQQIPLGAKIVSLADSFDAMTTDRPYRRRRSFEDVVRDLRESSGKQFDGKVVAAFARAILERGKRRNKGTTHHEDARQELSRRRAHRNVTHRSDCGSWKKKSPATAPRRNVRRKVIQFFDVAPLRRCGRNLSWLDSDREVTDRDPLIRRDLGRFFTR